MLTVFPIETDQVTGWVPETERDIHLDLMKQVHALGGEIVRPKDSEFYQSVKQAFAIVATTDSLLVNNSVITKGARGV